MSTVFITHHDESIYNVIKIPEGQKIFKRSQFKHKFITKKPDKRDPRIYQKHGTMGVAHIPPPEPSDYLRKGTWKPPMRPPELMDPDFGQHLSATIRKKPLVPVRDDVLKEQDAKLKYKEINQIRKNIELVLSMKPKRPDRVVVLDKFGTKKPLIAGLEPIFIYSDQYGKLPKYLHTYIKRKEQNLQRKKMIADMQQPLCWYITRDNRERILAGLKKNWAELQGQYQQLPILTDTIPKKFRKSKMEHELKQLEEDIVIIERHPYMYVYRDQPPLIPDNDHAQF